MNVDLSWSFKLFMMAVLCLLLNADKCERAIHVRRNTVHEATLGEQMKIRCPVSSCDLPPTVQWFKFENGFREVNISERITTDRKINKPNEATYFLIFNNILISDSGTYRCLYDHTFPHPENNTQLWLYLYTAAGIVGFVIIVIAISVLSMRGCNGQSKNRPPSENQYADMPMIEQPVHPSSSQESASPCGAPSHRTSRRKSPSAPTQRGNVSDQAEGRNNGPEEEGSSVVYAALNHQHLAGASPRPRTVVDERSEYSAIRIP